MCAKYTLPYKHPSAFVPGQVYHVVGVGDGSSLKLYLNGSLVASGAAGAAKLSNWPFHIGRGASSNGRFHVEGVVDEVAVYGYALSAERVRAHYDAGS